MKIAFVTNGLGFAGAEKMLTFVASQLAERGHECIIINLNALGGCYNEQRQSVSDKIKVFEISPLKKVVNRRLYHLQQVYKVSKEEKVDVIIGFTAFPNMYASLVAKCLHIKSIMSERGDPAKTEGSGKIKNYLIKKIINSSSGGVFQTSGASEYYSKRLIGKSVVIANPIFIKENVPAIEWSKRKHTIVSVGRLDNEQKRYDIMFKAFDTFAKTHSDYKLLLYGKGNDETLIKELASKMEYTGNVVFKGLTSQPMIDIADASMFLITSDYEGISNSLLEAMAVGLPCVSTNHTPGGARLLIKDRHNGLLAPIGDYNKLAACLSEFADNQELAKVCGENAKQVLIDYSPENIISQWEDYIRKVIGC